VFEVAEQQEQVLQVAAHHREMHRHRRRRRTDSDQDLWAFLREAYRHRPLQRPMQPLGLLPVPRPRPQEVNHRPEMQCAVILVPRLAPTLPVVCLAT
jgi:hypothetical protein